MRAEAAVPFFSGTKFSFRAWSGAALGIFGLGNGGASDL
jgi:hypothetical protein